MLLLICFLSPVLAGIVCWRLGYAVGHADGTLECPWKEERLFYRPWPWSK